MLIGATHRNLREMIDQHTFREDLYYRLNGLALKLPALRERTDLEAVARRILMAERPQDPPDLSSPVRALFRRYAWPGNIRQLANVLRTAAVMSAGEHEITTAHLSDDFLEEARQAGHTPAPAPVCLAAEPLPVPEVPRPAAAVPAHTLEQAEIELIRSTLEALGGNISAASKQLGISRNTIYRRLRGQGAETP